MPTILVFGVDKKKTSSDTLRAVVEELADCKYAHDSDLVFTFFSDDLLRWGLGEEIVGIVVGCQEEEASYYSQSAWLILRKHFPGVKVKSEAVKGFGKEASFPQS